MEKNKEQMGKEFWWLNEESLDILYNGYIDEKLTVQERVKQITTYIANILERPDLADGFYEVIAKGWASLSSPIWSNISTDKGLGISCFNSHIPNDLHQIGLALNEVSIQTKVGGGTSGYFGDLDPLGTELRSGAKTSGAVSFIKWFDLVTSTVMQNGTRRGYFAGYLPIDHPEIEEFISIKDRDSDIQSINTGVTVTNKWMEEMVAGDKEKRDIWAKVLKSRKEKGIPYLFFTDNANDAKPQVYKDKGYEIKSSNLCVSGDTLITTDKGDFEIGSKVGEKVKIWNGEEFSEVEIFKTGEDKELYVINIEIKETEELKKIHCTPEHGFFLSDGVRITAEDIKSNGGAITLEKFLTPDGEERTAVATYGGELAEREDTYCFTEPKRNRGMFNGVVTANCNEVFLPSTDEESFVCCLSSMNLELYDEWKDTDAVYLMTYFLDGVMEDFIRKSKHVKGLERNYLFAKRHRALGLGVLGYHSLLQKRGIPFETLQAQQLNVEIFKHIQSETIKASKDMAEEFGEPEVLKGYGLRNTTLMSIAPTTTSSAILGQVSPSIEPYFSNYYKVGLAKGSFMRKNKHLEELLESKGKNTFDIWESIRLKGGSVQHLDFLSQTEKDVFKTFKEISPNSIIQHAVARQPYIDQGQSLNLIIPNEADVKEVNKLMIQAWEMGLKGLYYQRGVSTSKEVATELMNCKACEA